MRGRARSKATEVDEREGFLDYQVRFFVDKDTKELVEEVKALAETNGIVMALPDFYRSALRRGILSMAKDFGRLERMREQDEQDY